MFRVRSKILPGKTGEKFIVERAKIEFKRGRRKLKWEPAELSSEFREKLILRSLCHGIKLSKYTRDRYTKKHIPNFRK